MIASIFDCDGTIYSAQFGRGLLNYVAAQGLNKRVRAYYAALLPRYLLRRLRLIPEESLNRPAIAHLGPLIAGWDPATAEAAFAWVADEFLLPTLRSHVLSRLRHHQAEGHRVVLLSGVFTPCLERIGAALNVKDLVGTRLDVQHGVYSGRITPPVVTGRDKLPMLKRFLAESRLEVEWAASYAYADSLHDHEILEAVGHPIAVHPDAELRTLARDRNWEVLEE